eukprot:gene6573-16425_t
MGLRSERNCTVVLHKHIKSRELLTLYVFEKHLSQCADLCGRTNIKSLKLILQITAECLPCSRTYGED